MRHRVNFSWERLPAAMKLIRSPNDFFSRLEAAPTGITLTLKVATLRGKKKGSY